MTLGTYPTPVEKLTSLCSARTELWVKRDDLTHPLYGGNKVRKLEHLISEAKRRGASRIVTFGAVGSHHVLATTLHAGRAGLPVAAILTPQPCTPHVVDNIRAALGAGLEAFSAASLMHVPVVAARVIRRNDYVVPPGGSNVMGAQGYVDAVQELSEQVASGEMPTPDAMVVALGSAGTAAGLSVGVRAHGWTCKVIGVRVMDPPLVTRASTLLLARAVARHCQQRASMRELGRVFQLEARFLGPGYGHATPEGESATEQARAVELVLDPTYTAKAFAAALQWRDKAVFSHILYWHTLSSAPLDELLAQAPAHLPPSLQELLR